MSLDYQLGGIKNWETVCRNEDKSLKSVTRNIIFSTMAVDIGHITEKNALEFFLRLQVSDALSQWPKAEPITLEQIRQHIGLRTNVSDKPRASWFKRHFEGAEREILYRERRDREEAAKKEVEPT